MEINATSVFSTAATTLRDLTAPTADDDEPPRVLETEANAQVKREVLGNGRVFSGIARTMGIEFLIRYVPLRTIDDEIVGMLAVWRRLDEVLG